MIHFEHPKILNSTFHSSTALHTYTEYRRSQIYILRSKGQPRNLYSSLIEAARQHHECRASKNVWIETSTKSVFTASIEAGATEFVFQTTNRSLAEEWKQLGRFTAIFSESDGQLRDETEANIGQLIQISSKEDLTGAELFSSRNGIVVMDASDWRIIPAENLVAAFQSQPAELMAVATSSEDAQVLLGALEVGVDGILLRTEDAAEARAVLQQAADKAQSTTEPIAFEAVTVTCLAQIALGDRVAVDLCSLLVPGEGLLVGSFSKGLFLVHSECAESRYINSRPFRINCGPVHAYVATPDGKTAYLSELKSGSEVLVVAPDGRQRTAVVGRVKIERRPLVLVETKDGDGEVFSILLQNAETVRLVGPERGSQPEAGHAGWKATSVTELRPGGCLLLRRDASARHTGVAIQESILERFLLLEETGHSARITALV